MSRLAVGALLILGALVAMVMSWGALHEVALAFQMSGLRAGLFPLVVDIPTVAAQLVLLAVARRGSGPRFTAWAVLIVFGVATVAGNALKVATLDLGDLPAPAWVAVVLYSTPALANLLLTHLAVSHLGAERVEQDAEPEPEPVAEAVDLDPEVQRARVVELGAEMSVRKVAAATGVPTSTVGRWLREHREQTEQLEAVPA